MSNHTRTCSIDGCRKRHVARGWCVAHYTRWVRHGDPLALEGRYGKPAKFLEDALSSDFDECIFWPHSKRSNGYGYILIDGVRTSAHRVVCERAHGPAPTKGHFAAHSCGQGHLGCVNPRHLRWATPAENQADRILHGTDSRGERHWMSKLSIDDVRKIRELRGQKTQREIAVMFGVERGTVSSIQTWAAWAWLDRGRPANGGPGEAA